MGEAVLAATGWSECPAESGLPARPLDTIAALREQRVRVRIEQARELRLAAHYAEQCSCVGGAGVVLPGTEGLTQLAGEGTPAVAEFAGLELAVALGVPETEAYALMRSALGIKHRLPTIWQLMVEGFVPVWLATKLEKITAELGILDVLAVEQELARRITSLPPGRVIAMAEGLVLTHLAPEVAESRRAEAADSRGVWFAPREGGVTDVRAVVNGADGIFLEAQVGRVARILKAGGSQESENARRAAALGVLASPARALQMIQADLLDEVPELFAESEIDPICPAAGQRGHTCGEVTVDPEKLLPRARLYVHLTDDTLRRAALDAGPSGSRSRHARAAVGSGAAGMSQSSCPEAAPGVVRPEGHLLKPLLIGWLGDVLGHVRLHVTPVLDVDGIAPVDSYEIPERMREAVSIRSPYSVFPFSNRRSRGLDLDHTVPYDGGGGGLPRPDGEREPEKPRRAVAPRGQTRVDNLGPLTRRQHRAKTHGGYRVRQLTSGVFEWRTPLGQRLLVTPSGTRRLE